MTNYNVSVGMFGGGTLRPTGWYDVRAYGAVGDGVTDDTSAIQAAIDACGAAGGGTVFFPQAIYACASALAIDSSGVKLFGGGSATILCTNSSALHMLEADVADNTEISGLVFDGDDLAPRCIHLKGSSNIEVKDCEIYDILEDGSDSSNEASAILVENSGTTASYGVKITNCHLHDISSTGTSVARGILFRCTGNTNDAQVQDIIISGCLIEDISPFDDADGIVFQVTEYGESYSDTPVNAIVSNNVFRDCHKRAIKIQNRGVTIIGNAITTSRVGTYAASAWTENCWAGIEVQEGDCVISGNVLTGTGGAAFQRGIAISGGVPQRGNVSVSGNTISNSTVATGEAEDPWEEADGIAVEDATYHTENITLSCNVIANTDRGIYVAYDVDNVSITGNSISNSVRRDIFLYTPTDTIDNLVISGNMLGSTGCNFSDALLTSNAYICINGLEYSGDSYIRSKAGDPEGSVTAPIGSIYRRTDGSTSTTLYVKESGTGNTGWVAK